MQERRRLKRRYLMFYSRVFDRKSGRLMGYISDMSPEGAMLICEEPVETEVTYRLSMDLPEGIFDKELLLFNARCVWCKPDVDPKFYGAGFHLEDIDPNDVPVIEKIILEYGFRDSAF